MRYQIRHAWVKYAAETILEDINFEIRDKEKIAVVGRNGCGKTTFLKLICGDVEMANPDSDESCGISMAGYQSIGYLRQISFPDGSLSAGEEIKKVFAPVFEAEKELLALAERMTREQTPEIMHRYDALQAKMTALGGYTWKQDMETMFQRFGFALSDLERPIGEFSGGQQTKIAFIKLLLSRPDIMLLDEPTNHLDIAAIEWLEEYLKSYDRAVVIVSHDRMFLDHITDVTYEIEYHHMKRYPGNYSFFMEQKKLAAEKQEKDYELQQKEIARLTEWIEKWKNTPTKVAATRSKRMAIEHMVKIEKPVRFDTKSFHAQFSPRRESHTEVIAANRLVIGYDHPLSEVSFVLRKGEKAAILGANGKGKSTLLKTLIGTLKPLGGSFRIGTDVDWVYFDQQAAVTECSDPEKTVLDDFWDLYPQLTMTEARGALGNFLFSQDDVYRKLGQLSGGERVRLALCKLFKTRPNLLILDEPTNHMDIIGKEALETMLQNYTGTVLYVSHDRYFVRKTATAILDFETDQTVWYPCGYDDFLWEKQKREARFGDGANGRKAAESGRSGAGKPGGAAAGGGRAGTGSGTAADVGTGKAAGTGRQGHIPTLDDVFDKKTYYNPGKIASRRRQQIEKYERQLKESEERLQELTMKQMDPALATDYVKLEEISAAARKEEELQENLLNWLIELEVEEHGAG